MVDIQYDITIIGVREVSRPYQMEGRARSGSPSEGRDMPAACMDASSGISMHWKYANPYIMALWF